MSQPPANMPPGPPFVQPLNYQGRRQDQRGCPGCGGGPLYQPSFTLWGGAIGHRLLGIEQCKMCRKWWVKSTGEPGGMRVVFYTVVGIVLGLVVAVFIAMSR